MSAEDDDFISQPDRDPFSPTQQRADRQVEVDQNEALVKQAQAHLEATQSAWRRLFAGVASPHDVKLCRADMNAFCRVGQSVFHPEQRVTDLLIGRNEVALRINEYLELDFGTLWERRNQQPIK